VKGLLASRKDAHEHRVVVDAVLDVLGARCDDVRATGPAPLVFADVTHLATTVSARRHDGVSIVDLVDALHPTPAVAGDPRDTALTLIRELETTARGRYAGPCGWVDADGNGAFVLALRGGEIDGARVRMHAGAGIVAGSDASAEWSETQQKLEPMLRAVIRP
jgi:isochorismate synthase EntC